MYYPLLFKPNLRTCDMLTYEIAERLNFANPPAFNNFFKRETGLTPKEYRDRNTPQSRSLNSRSDRPS